MVWLWIVLGLGIIVGSMSWLLPSPTERIQASRRSEAIALGLRIQQVNLDDWARERMERAHVIQYRLFCDSGIRSFTLWRVPGREEPWAAPPESQSWDLVDGALAHILTELGSDVYGVGANAGTVWIALEDAKTAYDATQIQAVLRSIVAALND